MNLPMKMGFLLFKLTIIQEAGWWYIEQLEYIDENIISSIREFRTPHYYKVRTKFDNLLSNLLKTRHWQLVTIDTNTDHCKAVFKPSLTFKMIFVEKGK